MLIHTAVNSVTHTYKQFSFILFFNNGILASVALDITLNIWNGREKTVLVILLIYEV